MTHPVQDQLRNRLLRAFSPADFELIRVDLEPLALYRGDVLIRPHEPIRHAYFIEDGLCSTIAIAPRATHRIEVGLIGREGVVGTPLLLGTDRTPNECLIQVSGAAFRIAAGRLRAALAASATLQAMLLRYVQAFAIQTAHTALSNGSNTVEERLARWLLMCRDRLDGDDLPLTHELIAVMLGVRRPGITVGTHILEGSRIIRAKRANITILDRAKLREAAGDSYGVPEAEYERLLGPPGSAGAPHPDAAADS